MESEQGTSTIVQSDDSKTAHNLAGSNVLAVFVVQFDVTKGNIVEWQYPEDYDLEGIEYQAICSGLHRIESDIIYFSRENVFGISVFQNMPTEVERGAHMKAIGVLVQPTNSTGVCGDVWRHQSFLEKELSKHMVISETIEPSRYEQLLQYYRQYQYHPANQSTQTVYPTTQLSDLIHTRSVNYALRNDSSVKITIPESFGLESFHGFVDRFGPDIFVLWKAALLRKRIMLINMPPMEVACKYVYNIHLLGQVPAQFQRLVKRDILPKFTVGVNDIPQLEKRNQSFVACTPDSIFQTKSDLYDVLVTLPSPSFQHPIKGSNQNLAPAVLTDHQHPIFKSTSSTLSKHNPADFKRFRILCSKQTSSKWPAATEPNDVISAASALLTGVYYWLYETDESETAPAQSRFMPSWQDLFAGSSNRHRHAPIYMNRQTSSTTEEQSLLLVDEDATELNNNQVFEAVAARASAELQEQESNVKNQALLRFFYNLNCFLLVKLQMILSINEEEGLSTVHLYPKDMVQLGLDPQTDVAFVKELAELYFKKHVKVHGLTNLAYITSTSACCYCCCCPRQQRIQI